MTVESFGSQSIGKQANLRKALRVLKLSGPSFRCMRSDVELFILANTAWKKQPKAASRLSRFNFGPH